MLQKEAKVSSQQEEMISKPQYFLRDLLVFKKILEKYKAVLKLDLNIRNRCRRLEVVKKACVENLIHKRPR